MAPGSLTSCSELFLELYSLRDPPLAVNILFPLSCHRPSKGWRISVNENIAEIVLFEHAK